MINFLKNPKNLIWILLLIAILTRLPFLQNSLWHNDAADFVNSAVHWADTGNYLPAHSPDYPGWVLTIAAAETIFRFLSGDYSLVFLPNLLSCLFGIGSILLLFLITQKITDNKTIAFLAGIFLTFMPGFWAINELALSDGPAIFWILLALYYLLSYTENSKNSHLIFYGLSVIMSILTRINSLIFLPVLAIFITILLIKKKGKINRQNIFLILATIAAPLFSLLIYFLIHQSSWEFILQTSRRTNPNFNDFLNTAVKLWIISSPPLFLLWLTSIWQFIKNKSWPILSLLTIPVILFYYYYAGWWQNGSFDVNRYLIITSPFIALGASLACYNIFKSHYKIWKIAVASILAIYSVFILLGLGSINFCAKTLNTFLDKTIISPIYCSTRFYAKATEERLDVFTYIQKITPTDAIIMINDYEWSYSHLFGNKYDTENRIFVNLKKDNKENIKIISANLRDYQAIYIPIIYITKDLINEINAQQWPINFDYLKQNDKAMVLKIFNKP